MSIKKISSYCSATSTRQPNRGYLFTYGTLMCPELMQQICGHTFKQPFGGTLKGFQRHQLKMRHYPGIRARRGKQTQGVLYPVTVPDLKKLDHYEGREYIRQTVTVATRSGSMQAWCYVLKKEYAELLLPQDWHDFTFCQA